MIVIGEKINATRTKVKEIIDNRDTDKLLDLAREQVKAGAGYIDVNVGTGTGTVQDEINSMQWAVSTIQSEIDKPLCIDSADPAVLEAGLTARDGMPSMVNSTKASDESLDSVVPIAARFSAPLVALVMNEKGIPKTVEERLDAGKKIASACDKHGLEMKNVYFDPLVIPISTDMNQGIITLDTVASLKKEFPEAKTVMGLSNISYGLPARATLNAAFLQMAVYAGLDAAIMDPMNDKLMEGVKTANALVGKDRHFRRFTKAFRKRK